MASQSEPVGLGLVVQGVVGRVPLDPGPLGSGRDHCLERRARDDRVPPSRLDQHRSLRVVDPRERVDRLEHLADDVLELRRRALHVRVHRRRARGHEHGGADAIVDASDERRETPAHAPADEPEPVGVHAVVVGEDVEGASGSDHIVRDRPALPPDELLAGRPGRRGLGTGGGGDREGDRAALRELHRGAELLLAVSSGTMEEDDARELPAGRPRRDQIALDAVVAARVRDALHDDAVLLRARPLLEGDRRPSVVGQRVVGRAAAAAAAAAREERGDEDREEDGATHPSSVRGTIRILPDRLPLAAAATASSISLTS